MSGFRVAPRKGHLKQVQHIVTYLVKMKHAAIRFRTEEPDFSTLPDQQFDWAYTIYGHIEEKFSLVTCLLPWASLSLLLTTWMQTCTMT